MPPNAPIEPPEVWFLSFALGCKGSQGGLGQLHLGLLGVGHQPVYGDALVLHHQHQLAALALSGNP
jgi:hypothetical protein